MGDGGGQMDQWVNALVQPDDLRSVPVIHMVEGENQLLQGYPLVSAWDELTHAHVHTCTYAYTRAHTLIK